MDLDTIKTRRDSFREIFIEVFNVENWKVTARTTITHVPAQKFIYVKSNRTLRKKQI